jgi:hypothetical protein
LADNIREGVRMNFDAAVNLLESAIKSLFLLNGAGLVGLPTIVGLFQRTFDSPYTIIWLGLPFMLGVLSATGASLFGYASAMRCVQSLNNAMNVTIGNYVSAYYSEPAPANQATIANDLTLRAVRLHYRGIALGVVSLVCFLVGTTILLGMFGSHPFNPKPTGIG